MANIKASWTKLAESQRLQRSSQTIAVLGSAAYIFGGELLPREPIDNQLDVVSLGEGMQCSHSNAPSPRVGSSCVAIKNALYLFSGRGGIAMAPVEENGAVWRYTPADSTWMLITPADPSAPFVDGRSYHAATSNGVDTFYLHAGCPEKGRKADLWSFSVESRTWTALPAAPPPTRGGTSIAFSNGKIYRMNGFDGEHEQGGAIDVFDIAKETWSTISFQADGVQGPEARSVAALVIVQSQGKDLLVTLFGERDPSALGHAGAGKMLSDVWAFDIDHEIWKKLEFTGDIPSSRLV
ncbi:Nitrile-specifier protein 5 like [Verticillium longisporum]|uniref:Nitrile-specifier protein 5 like n=1 Tax=Verticillium longisporum TaxID=100787 RepID=A0A8I3AK37_VERLO|nr:Nitrile-specifier protein 5 like [Verticillium longisporum]